MIYSGDISYNEPYFQYNGIRIVSPSSFGPTASINNPKLLAVVIISPESINSTLVLVNTHNIIASTGIIEVTDSNSFISFSTLNNQEGYMIFDVLNQDGYAVTQTESLILDNNQEAYIAFNVLNEDAYALSQAQTIILNQNSAGTVDVTIIPTS